MKLLTEAERNKIKREIGDAFRRVLKLAEVKIILRKEPGDRGWEDIDKLVEFLGKLDFFKNLKNFGYSQMRDLALTLKYKEINEGEQVYAYGDDPKNFYIVLDGAIGIE